MSAPRLSSGMRRDLVRCAFRDYFGIGDARANVLIALYERKGDPVRTGCLASLVDSHRRPTAGAIQETIRILRMSMDAEAIDHSEAGYFLSEVGLDECRLALRETASVLAGFGGAPDAEAAPFVRTMRTA